jgi:hypothetical protein
MKKLVLAFTALLFFGSAVAQKQVALVTFYSDKKIGGTGLGTAAESLIDDPSFNLQPLVDKSYERFVKEFAKDFPFGLMDNNEITGNEEYRNYSSKFLMDTAKTVNKLLGIQYVTAANTIFAYGDNQGFTKEEKRDPCNLAKIFPTADGILFVTMDYEFEPRLMGMGAGIRAYLNMFLYDKQCNKVFRIRESAPSKGKVPAVAGIPVMDPKKIQPLCEDATEELFNDLKGRLGKVVKTSGKL